MDLHKIMTGVGLNEKEAKIYLACLELGKASASEIGLRAKLNRVTSYDILKKLIQKGYVSSVDENEIKTFSAKDPEEIKNNMREKYINLKSAIPELRRLYGKTQHPQVKYYEGTEAVKKVYSDSLNAKSEILNYADSRLVRQFWPEYDEEYVSKRVKNGIYLRGIAPQDAFGEKVAELNKKSYREIRLVPGKSFPFHNEINIYDDKVSIISFGKDEILGMIIQNQEIADTQRAIFSMAWEFSKNFKKGFFTK